SVITTVFSLSGWYTALGGRKISWAIAVTDETSIQMMTNGRANIFLRPKSKEKSSGKQQEFYRGVNEK
ncbi:MAG TPA: hypothetical protein VHQ04_07945, partial [Puia sp.]|nr:hypothetical protein [Puia sp.]